MAKRRNRVVWALLGVLAVVVLGGAIWFATSDPATFYRYGVQRGRQDARGSVDLGPSMAADWPSALLYLQMAPGLMEAEAPIPTTPAERQARKRDIDRAAQLAAQATSAPNAEQRRLLRSFVNGYKLGHHLK
jgi:hypothetical protein